MFKFNKDQQTTKTNEQADRDLASLSDQELVPALLEQVVGGSGTALTCFKSEAGVSLTCFKSQAGVALTCFK